MAKQRKQQNKSSQSVPTKRAYLFLEGDTEHVFYKRIFDQYLQGIPKTIKNLKTGSGINLRIAKELHPILKSNASKDEEMYVYVFIDREGPSNKDPDLNEQAILSHLAQYFPIANIKKIQAIEAIQMIESWFFYDLETILKHIQLKGSTTLRQRYSNPQKLTHKDLEGLFNKGSKNTHYRKGDARFLNKLDIDKIYNNASELKKGMQDIINDMR